MYRTLIFKLKNLFFRTQLCEKCGKDLANEPEQGFEQLEHCGVGRYKICSKCKQIFYL